jgi:hypothetical protein
MQVGWARTGETVNLAPSAFKSSRRPQSTAVTVCGRPPQQTALHVARPRASRRAASRAAANTPARSPTTNASPCTALVASPPASRHEEQITARVALGATLVVAGPLVLVARG